MPARVKPNTPWTTNEVHVKLGEGAIDPGTPALRRMPLKDVRVVAEGLVFPEGPIALADGAVLVVETRRGVLSRVEPDGRIEVVAQCGDGPNGAAVGPDGAVYVCNNGGPERAARRTGRIQRVDLATGTVEDLYIDCGGHGLRAPNDIVFDQSGGFWFSDYGISHERTVELGSVYYALPNGSAIYESVPGLDTPNGVGLSPDGSALYYTQTRFGRLVRRRIEQPGQLEASAGLDPLLMTLRGIDADSLLVTLPGYQPVDSLAVDDEGWIAIGTLWSGCITAVAPDGSAVEQHFLPEELRDRIVTNICFGGDDLRTAYVTLSETGRLVACRWPRRGLPTAF